MSANPKQQSTALAVRPSGAVARALEGGGQVLGMSLLEAVAQGKANLVSPAVMLDQVPAMHRLAVRVVTIDPDRMTYPAPGKPGEVCLAASALQKIASNAQVSWDAIRQIDDWRDPHRVKYEAVGRVRNLDGSWTVMAPGIVVIDLRGEPSWPEETLGTDARAFLQAAARRAPFHHPIPDGTEQRVCRDCQAPVYWVKSKAGKNLPVNPDGICHWETCSAKEKDPLEDGWKAVYQARQFIDRLAVTKAQSAAIRKLGVPSSMPAEVAAAPWVVMALVFDPPVDDDPEVRRMLVAHALGAQMATYGPPRAVPEPARVDVSHMVEAPPDDAYPVDAEVAAVDAEPDPWETFEQETAGMAPGAPPLPIPAAAIEATSDGERRNYLRGLNLVYRQLEERLGPDAEGWARKHAATLKPESSSLEEMATIGRALRAELVGGAR